MSSKTGENALKLLLFVVKNAGNVRPTRCIKDHWGNKMDFKGGDNNLLMYALNFCYVQLYSTFSITLIHDIVLLYRCSYRNRANPVQN